MTLRICYRNGQTQTLVLMRTGEHLFHPQGEALRIAETGRVYDDFGSWVGSLAS